MKLRSTALLLRWFLTTRRTFRVRKCMRFVIRGDSHANPLGIHRISCDSHIFRYGDRSRASLCRRSNGDVSSGCFASPQRKQEVRQSVTHCRTSCFVAGTRQRAPTVGEVMLYVSAAVFSSFHRGSGTGIPFRLRSANVSAPRWPGRMTRS